MPSPTRENELSTLRAVVGALSVSPEDTCAMLDDAGVTGADFADPSCQSLFAALEDCARTHSAPDIIAISNAVGRRVPRELVVDLLTNADLGAAPVRLRLLKDASRLRSLVASVSGLLRTIQGDGIGYDAAREAAESMAKGLAPGASTLGPMDADVIPFLDKLDSIQRGTRVPLLSTGNAALDFHIGGLRQTLTIIGSLPGVGKSALLAAIAANLIQRGDKIGVFSLEDEREWLLRRVLAFAAKVPLFVLGARPMTSVQLSRVEDAGSGVHEALKNLIVEDRQGMTTAEVVAGARRMIAAGCKAIFVDHLGEVRLERTDRHDLDIIDALQQLRGLAKTYRVPVVVLCHLRRREGLDQFAVPKLTDFAFSSGVERMARVALGLFRVPTKDGRPESLGVSLLKQTEGPSGHGFELNFAKLYGVVDATEPSAAAREEQARWSE